PKYASSTSKDEKGFVKYEKFIDKLKPECFQVHTEKNKKSENNSKNKNVNENANANENANEDVNEDELGLETWSPKMVQFMTNLSIHLPPGMLDFFKELAKTEKWMPELLRRKQKPGVGPGVIYSQFLDSGIGLVGKTLEHHGMKEIKSIL